MTEDEAWEVFGIMHDEEKVTPSMRSGYAAPQLVTYSTIPFIRHV